MTGPEMVLESTPYASAGVFTRVCSGARETGWCGHFFPPWWEEAGYRAAPVEEASLTEDERDLVQRVLAGVGMEEYSDRAAEGLDAGADERSDASFSCRVSDRDLGQIAYRREMKARQGGLAAQEFAESAESCFFDEWEPVL